MLTTTAISRERNGAGEKTKQNEPSRSTGSMASLGLGSGSALSTSTDSGAGASRRAARFGVARFGRFPLGATGRTKKKPRKMRVAPNSGVNVPLFLWGSGDVADQAE